MVGGGECFFRRIAYFFMTEFIMSLLFSGICLACVFVFFETKFDLVFSLFKGRPSYGHTGWSTSHLMLLTGKQGNNDGLHSVSMMQECFSVRLHRFSYSQPT